MIGIIAGFYLNFHRFNLGIRKSGIPDDQIFSKGFISTGREWPPKEESFSEELKQNPLTRLREAYCNRIGYQYADFGGGCFVFQYYDSYGIYRNDEERFTVYYPTLWRKTIEPANYGFTASPRVSLIRQGASCGITYGLIDENKLLSLSGISTSKITFGVQASGGVDSDAKGLNKKTLSFGRELNNEEKAAGYTDTKLIAIPHFPYPSSKFGFLLTSGDKQPLIEACVEEFDSILNSRAINYPSVKLSDQSDGTLSIRDVSSWFETYAQIPQRTTLVFDNFITGREESVANEAFENIQRIYDPFLSTDKLFYIEGSAENPTVRSINIFTGETSLIPLLYDPEKLVHSFFIKENALYYLVGKNCNDYLVKCENLSLKSYNLKSGLHEDLTGGVTSRDIDGFDSNGETIILRYSDGDGGCRWGSYQSFTLSNKILKDLGSYSQCMDTAVSLYDSLKNLATGSGSFDYLIVKNGKIYSPNPADTNSGRIHIRVNTLEYPPAK